MTDASGFAPPALAPDRVRAVLFDLDGTLIDSYGPIGASLNHARAHFGLPPLAHGDVRRRVGRGLESLIAELVGVERVAHGVKLFRERYAEVFADGTLALPHVAETLARLHRAGYRLAVASNKPARFSSSILHGLELAPFIRWIQGPEAAIPAKPHPAILHACLHRLGVRVTEALYVGDMVLDVESATRAGVPVVLVEGGSSTAEDLRRTGQRTLASLHQLGEMLGVS